MRKVGLIVYLVVVLVPLHMIQAQYVLTLSDEDCVSLSLDMIRKGVQQQRAGGVMRVVGSSVLVQGTERKSDTEIAQILEDVFANSSSRETAEGRKALPPSGLAAESNLWDFDILSAEITVSGDSAVVECELVLWGAVSEDSREIGSRISETLVFRSPFEDQPSQTQSNDPRRWKLVGCNNLFSFLTNYGE